MTKAARGATVNAAAADLAAARAAEVDVPVDIDPETVVGPVVEADAPTPARISKRVFSKPFGIDSMRQFGSHLVVRLWAVDATEFIRIIVRTKGEASGLTRVSTLFYSRRDAEEVAGPAALGLTVVLKDPTLVAGGEIEVMLVTLRDEILVLRGTPVRDSFHDFFAGVMYDVQRAGRPIEQRLLFDRSRALQDLLQSSWGEYLTEQKQAYISFGKTYRPATFSIITVFYRRPFIASIYALTAKILELPPGAEVVLCFQQAAVFQQQIDYLEGLFRMFQINHRFVLFEENVGFSASNNIGVEQSSAPRILLVNPDICCNDASVYEAIAVASDSGDIYGATLLSDADEVMHNGIELLEQTVVFKSKAIRVMRTSHIGRHSPVELIEEGEITEAEAVSGALIGVRRDVWDELGGLPEHFVLAHFEDVEFCRSATAAGIGVKVYNSRLLIHLESYGAGEDSLLHAIKQVNSAIFNAGAK